MGFYAAIAITAFNRTFVLLVKCFTPSKVVSFALNALFVVPTPTLILEVSSYYLGFFRKVLGRIYIEKYIEPSVEGYAPCRGLGILR